MWYEFLCLCVVTQSCPTLCDPMDHIPLGSPIPGILQARTLEWPAISSSRSSCQPRDQAWSPALAGRFFTTEPMGKARCCVRWVIKGTCRKGHLRALESHGCGQGCCVRHLGESEVLPKWKHLQGQTQNTKQPQQSGLDQGRPRGQALQGQTLLTWPLPSDIRTLSDGCPPVPTCSPPLTTRSPAGCFMKMSLKA